MRARKREVAAAQRSIDLDRPERDQQELADRRPASFAD